MSSSSASVKKSTPEPSSSSSLSLTPVRSFVNDQFSGKDAFYVSSVTIGSVLASYYGTKLIKYVKKVGIKAAVFRAVMSIAKTIPGASGAIEAEKQKIAGKMESMIIPKEVYEEKTKYITIPEKGLNSRTLLELMAKWKSSEENRWGNGHVSGGIYHGGSELTEVLTQAYSFFALSNPLHPEVFPYVRKMEAEVIAMTLNLFNGTTPDHCGAMTSGGTESILMAMKSYRERARSKGIERPNIVCAVSAHAAFDKAAHYFDMDIIKVPVDPITFKMDINAAKKAINSSTAVIVGSAPGFPHGIIDPISELNELALKHNIGLHVDCCLGSFLVCLLEKIGCPPPPFDFRLPGVSSISCDTHKYGYAPKGSSVVMFNSKELRQYMYFVAADWTGGIYASPTMPGSRPGGLVAATWAALVHIGLEGYIEIGKNIMNASKTIQEGIKKIDGLKLIGKPDMSIIAFTHDPESTKTKSGVLNIFKVGEAMSQRHWVLNTLQKPGAVHICLTKMHVPVVDRFLSDLQWAVDEVVNNPDKFKNGSAAIYGMTESLPDNSLVTDLAKTFIDTLFKPA